MLIRSGFHAVSMSFNSLVKSPEVLVGNVPTLKAYADTPIMTRAYAKNRIMQTQSTQPLDSDGANVLFSRSTFVGLSSACSVPTAFPASCP